MTFQSRSLEYFHLSQWKDEQIQFGPIYRTNWNLSLYGTRQLDQDMNAEGLKQDFAKLLPDQLKALKGMDLLLDAIGKGKAKVQKNKDLIFEQVRLDEFPDLPSRLNSMFLCETESRSRTFANTYKFEMPPYRVFQIECLVFEEDLSDEDLANNGMTRDEFNDLSHTNRHRGNPKFLDCNVRDESEIVAYARKYWTGEATGEDELTEVLLRGFYRIVRVCD